MDDRTAAFEKQEASPFLRTQHQRPLRLFDNEYRQPRLLSFALTGLVNAALAGDLPLGRLETGV
jgi:hypothetical protein